MTKTERFKKVLEYFAQHNPEAETELRYSSAFELLVAVILSAQCTDKRINIVTPSLFKRFPDPQTLAASSQEEVFDYIKSISYPNNKAKSLIGMARMLCEEFNGIIPSEIDALQKLPGVGRKTANVIASVVFNKPALAVDTHVFRVSARLGLTVNARTPLETERQLVKYIPESQIAVAHHWLILHGRYVCIARKPKCLICPLTAYCKYYQKNSSVLPDKITNT
ncbi:MAG: endonuclease III [Bacteroidetes bacterium]|nr:endonuclease III [Bacteroidota bacterium]HET6244101.1 endonuclease III [Bacteroidia bacterium]